MSDTLRQSQSLQCKYDFKNDKYLTFIAEVRDLVRDNNRTSHGCHILPLEEEADPFYLDLKLQEGGIEKGFVKIRRYDLRIINYQDPFGNSLDVNEFQLYDDDSRLLKFGIEDLKLGLSTFLEAVNYLLSICQKPGLYDHNADLGTSFLVICDKKKLANTQEKFKVRTSLGVLCLVICEGIKVDLFSSILSNAFELGFEVPLSLWLLDRINDWSFFSKQLLSYEIHLSDTSECNTCMPYDLNDWHDERWVIGITCRDVVKFLGICKAFPSHIEPIEVGCHLEGNSLVEVFSVSVYFSDGQSGSVYGSITVDTDNGSFSIYERDSNESELIESHGTLSLQDPNGFLSSRRKVEFLLDLKDVGGNLEINKSKTYWDGSLGEDYLDSRLAAMVKGKCGYAIVYYSIFVPAIQVVVEATLLIKENHSHANENVCVFGRFSTRFGLSDFSIDSFKKYYETILYHKPVSKACTCKQVQSGKAFKLKLSKTRVNVRLMESLIILAELKNCDGKPIVTGSIELLPEHLSEFEEIMQGRSDDSHLLQLKVKRIV